MKIRTYSDLKKLSTFEERYEYLRLGGIIGESTFGFERYLNQIFYHSNIWKEARNKVIIRDNGCDLGIEGYDIVSRIIVHHLNPISIQDLQERNEDIFNPEYLICVSEKTHNAIHYGDVSMLPKKLAERKPGDTCPWK